MIFEVKDAVCGYKKKEIIKGISFNISSGEIMCLLGPNGVGKTTLFKSMLGFLPLIDGSIYIDGDNIQNWPMKKQAQYIGYVPQSHTPPFPFSVMEVVVMSRVAHHGMASAPGKKDMEIALKIMQRLNIEYLADKLYTEISGGERQMVLIARALTQEPKLLVMDEPTSNLDFGNQVRVIEQINSLAAQGLAVIMTTHFPDHAYLCSSKVMLIEHDSHYTVGYADDIISEENLKRVYNINVKIVKEKSEINGKYQNVKGCIPLLRVVKTEDALTSSAR